MRNTIPPLVLMMACTGDTEKVDGNGAPEIQSLVITGTDFGTSDTLTCTVQYSDPDGDVVTESYEWTNQRGDIIGTANTITLQLGAVEPTEMVNCMVTLNDGTVSVSEIVSTTIENTNPTVDSVSIEPNEGITPESTLMCSATASDVDGGEPTLSYAWERNGQPLASTPSLSLPVLGDAAMGDTFVCTATALDVHGGEGSDSNSVTVGNSPPSIESVELVVANNPDLPFTSQLDIECVANNVTDPNDDIVTLTYRWSINGSVQNSVAGPILSSPFSVGDEIGCAVTPNDGFDDGDVVESNVVIPNTLPEIFSVEIDPSTDVEADNTLVCTVDAFDADDGVLVGQYEWLDGDGNSAGIGNTLTLNPVQNRPNDEITCIARVSDNDGANTEFQSSVWIINTDPVVSNPASISATPSPTSAGVLTCAAGFSDLNDGTLTPTYTWTLSDGSALSGNGSTYTINPAENNPTDTIVCTASAVDGDGSSIETSTTVVIENTPPSIDSLSIAPGNAVEANVTLEMLHSISDIDAEALTVEYDWIDDSGASLGTGQTLVLDNSRPVGSTITASLLVTDSYGATDSTTEFIDILNTLPVNDLPASISTNPSPVTTGVLTCTASFSDYNDGSLTPSYTWTLLDGTQLPSVGNTLTIDANTTDPTDEIFCTATASDDDGESINSSTSIVVQNTAPSIDSFNITPGNAVEANVTLEMVYTASDLDGENLTHTFEWTDDQGTVLGTDSTLILDNTRPVGSSVIGTLTVTDGYGGLDSVSGTVSIENTLPVLDAAASIASTPAPKTTGVLTCAAQFSDYNDGNLAPLYTWTLGNGSFLTSGTNTYTISESQTNPGDEVICTATASDNNGESIESSTSVIIDNTDPTVDSFAIAPDTSVEANTTLEMQVSYSDVDNQTLNAVYEWRSATGSLLGSSNILPLNSTYAVDSTITGTFTVTDLNGGTATQSDVVTILNTPPTVSSSASISANPSPITTGVLTCTASFSDYNDGSLTPSYTWTLLDGTQLPSVGNTLTIDANTTDPTDEIFCTATASDDDGESINSSTSIVVQNTAPSIDSFNITPGNAVEANVTLEMVLTVSDVDNDTLSIQYSWLNNQGQSVGTGSSLTLDNSYAVGTTLTAVATLSDEYGASDVATQTVTIENTLPQISTPAVISANPSAITGGTLTCNATFTDFNEGSISPTYAWKKGGVNIGSGNTYTIDANDASPTDTIQCQATATDGSGDSVSSVASIVVQNTNPTVNTVSISPSTAYDDSTITCGYSASDVDSNESQTPSYAWTRNGSNVAGTSSTYAGSLSVGDTIGCSVTVVDNYGGSNSSSALQTISNRAPTILSIALPTNINSQTDVTVIVAALEDDNQSLTITYDWYKKDASNGNAVTSIGSNSATLPASQFDKHDIIYVVATVSDGIASVTGTSGNRQIINTLPTAPTVSVSPSTTSTFVGSDLTCAVTTPSSDLDGDAITYHFEWFNPSGGLESDTYTTSTTDIYLGNNVDQLGTWTCQVTPADDDGDGPSAAASTNALGLETCLDYSNAGNTVDGVYTLYINGTEINAYCDMNTDGGGWTLFAITSNTQCAETLPFGSNELTSVSGSAYLTTLFKDFSHTEFLQDFRANGVSTTFDIIYGFSNSKTVSQRFNDSVSSGENVDWIVYYNNSTYNYSGNWMFSSTANTASKWSTSGSGFSNDDGIWGAQNGSLNGNSPGPYLGNSGWGHQNRDGSDSICGTYYYNGTSSTSASIKNLMFFR